MQLQVKTLTSLFQPKELNQSKIRVCDSGNKALQIYVGQKQAMSILPSGKIGIGTNAPQNRLDIIGVTSSDEFLGQEVRVKPKK